VPKLEFVMNIVNKMHKYYCKKCKKNHHRGKIYRDHLVYKREEFNNNVNSEVDYTNIDLNKLRPIAKRQLRKLLKKMKSSGNHEFYKNEIIKLIEYENRNY
jgi:hypothetical protein